MKRAISTSLLLFVCTISSMYGMNFLRGVKKSLAKGIQQIKGDDYLDPFKEYDKMRSALFVQLKQEYKHSDAKEVSKEDIMKLKDQLVDKNTRSKIRNGDIRSCLQLYDSIYKVIKNEENNRYFIDTILPVLLNGHTFERTAHNEDYHYSSDSNDFIFMSSTNNVHLMRTLIFQHEIPLKMTAESWTLRQLYRVKNLEKIYGSPEEYLKAILTPPDSWLQETKKDIIATMCFFIIGLQKLKKENPHTSHSYNLPKAVIFNCILRELIKSSVAQEAREAYRARINDIKEDLEIIKRTEERLYTTFKITSFLENSFEQWAEKTINPEEFLYNAIVKQKKK